MWTLRLRSNRSRFWHVVVLDGSRLLPNGHPLPQARLFDNHGNMVQTFTRAILLGLVALAGCDQSPDFRSANAHLGKALHVERRGDIKGMADHLETVRRGGWTTSSTCERSALSWMEAAASSLLAVSTFEMSGKTKEDAASLLIGGVHEWSSPASAICDGNSGLDLRNLSEASQKITSAAQEACGILARDGPAPTAMARLDKRDGIPFTCSPPRSVATGSAVAVPQARMEDVGLVVCSNLSRGSVGAATAYAEEVNARGTPHDVSLYHDRFDARWPDGYTFTISTNPAFYRGVYGEYPNAEMKAEMTRNDGRYFTDDAVRAVKHRACVTEREVSDMLVGLLNSMDAMER